MSQLLIRLRITYIMRGSRTFFLGGPRHIFDPRIYRHVRKWFMLFVACLTTATSLISLTILTRIAICLFVAIMFGDDICRFGVVGRVRIKGLTSFDDAIFESQGLMIRSSTIKPTAILEEGADRNLLVIAKIW